MHSARTCLILTCTVNVIFGLDDVRSLAHTVKIVASGVVLRRAIIPVTVSAELAYRLHASGTLVLYLHVIIVSVGRLSGLIQACRQP